MPSSNWKRVQAILVLSVASAVAAHAQTFTTLADFDTTDGANPAAGLVQGADGNFYGTTDQGGRKCGFGSCGIVFRVTPGGTITAIYGFCFLENCTDGQFPQAPLVLSNDGKFYGTTSAGGDLPCGLSGGCGTVFSITPNGKLTTLYRFCSLTNCTDGVLPTAALVQAANGDFYGTTSQGAILNGGTVFKITAVGKLTTLYSFCSRTNCADGAYPVAGLIQASDGSFYGTTAAGGSGRGNCDTEVGCGTIFRIMPSGAFTKLYDFCSQPNCTDGGNVLAGLIQATDGSLYGTTQYGGGITCDVPHGCGTIFKIAPEGTVTTLHTFEGTDGLSPIAGLVQATNGNFYGTTRYAGPNGYGTIFQITSAGVLTTLHGFDMTDGSVPNGLLQSTNGILYGTAGTGGDCCGTVFSLSTGLGPFVSFVIDSGRVGQTGGTLGQGFTGTTSVSLNGTSASFTVVSDTYITATVPPGATSGFATVTTPSGTLTSNKPFQVLP